MLTVGESFTLTLSDMIEDSDNDTVTLKVETNIPDYQIGKHDHVESNVHKLIINVNIDVSLILLTFL